MPIEKVRGLIDEVAQMGVGEFLVTGGEPLARADLAEVIGYLGRKGVNWSLNTAAMPDRSLREVIASNRPGFVAVSLDGPKPVHDVFRGKAGAYDEAVEAIRFFKSLEGVRVCAGTTVTSRNYDCLHETFYIVAGGGADQWGIHLLVPEGRAAGRPDLFLSKTQLKRLIKFVARKRRYFDVEMADEIGYLGYLEPLVRDVPQSCGAGRVQCVVLPDGAVVPCTTLDRSYSAGNIHERRLAQIWAEGFNDLRSWRPSGKCSHCDYSPACRGGCWLQRKSGTECFKEVWHVPGTLKTAAGIAICLGGLAAHEDSRAATIMTGTVSTRQAVSLSRVAAMSTVTLDDAILDFHIAQAAGRTPSPYGGIDWSEPAWKFFSDFTTGKLAQDITERCAAASGALETQQRSLSLIALLWRAVNEPLFAPDNMTEYSQAEREMIRNTLAAIKQKADDWRLEIFAKNLDPYLANGRQTPRPIIKKSASPPVYIDRYFVVKDLNEERWGAAADPETRDAAEAYLEGHHYADQMDLQFRFYNAGQLTKYSGANSEVLSSQTGGQHTIGVFDVIGTANAVQVCFDVYGSVKTSTLPVIDQEMLLADESGAQDVTMSIVLSLEAGREYTYAELLKTAYQQRSTTLLPMAYDWLLGGYVSLWSRPFYVMATVHENEPLLWPAFRDIADSDWLLILGQYGLDPRRGTVTSLSPTISQRAVLKDIDFWMF
jgi:radical SAM protein with 4Fe4S-binding SPASM domain